jgi:hypothetical protein
MVQSNFHKNQRFTFKTAIKHFFQLILYILFLNIFEHFKFISHTLRHFDNDENENPFLNIALDMVF